MKKFLSISAFVALLGCPLLAQPYTLDSQNSKVDFQISHLKLTKVDGKFKKFSANIDYDLATKKLNILEGSVEIALWIPQTPNAMNTLMQQIFLILKNILI